MLVRHKILFIASTLLMFSYLLTNCSVQSSDEKLRLLKKEIANEERIKHLESQIKLQQLEQEKLKTERKTLKEIDPKLAELLQRLNKSSRMMKAQSIDTASSPIDIQDTGEIVRFNLSDTNNRPTVLVNP